MALATLQPILRTRDPITAKIMVEKLRRIGAEIQESLSWVGDSSCGQAPVYTIFTDLTTYSEEVSKRLNHWASLYNEEV